jgi:hypothetical protein
MTPDVVTLLEAARTDPDVRPILADAIQDDDGETAAVKAVRDAAAPSGCLLLLCERCGCPEAEMWVGWDARHHWHYLLGEDDFWIPTPDGDELRAADRCRNPKVTLYRSGRWHLVCPHCKRSLVAAKANATRRANEAAARDAGGLFAGCE